MIKNLSLLLASIFLIISFGELVFPKLIGKLPLRLYGLIDKDLRILAQSSKKSQLPKDYIALTGDSYAVGAGDWLNKLFESHYFGSPDYSAAHLIYKKIGIDVVSFGQAGVGSFNGIWSEPVTQFLHINSTRNFRLPPPKYFLIFFYEGNDVYDNIRFLNHNNIDAVEKKMEEIEFREVQRFLTEEFEKQIKNNLNNSLWENMIFTRFLFQGTSNFLKRWFSSEKLCQNPIRLCHVENMKNNKLLHSPLSEGKVGMTLIGGKPVKLNEALMNGKKVGLPMSLQAPPQFGLTKLQHKLGMAEQLIELSMFVFEKSVGQLASFFPQSKINIIYIPSPLSSYNIVSSHIHFRGSMEGLMGEDVGETVVAEQKHKHLCETIRSFAELNNFSFVNTTKSLRKAAMSDFVHGPIDWDHFNKRGYQALSDHLAELFLQPSGNASKESCEY